jgi:hypothetical protein
MVLAVKFKFVVRACFQKIEYIVPWVIPTLTEMNKNSLSLE